MSAKIPQNERLCKDRGKCLGAVKAANLEPLNLTRTVKLELLANAQSFATLFSAQHVVEDHTRNKHSCEQVGEQSESERHCEAPHRAGSEYEQNERRYDRGHVGVNDRD